MNEADWKEIPLKMREAGFALSYERISYSQWNPLWRAAAHRAGREWIALGRDLEAALVELERQTMQSPVGPRTLLSEERATPSAAVVPRTN